MGAHFGVWALFLLNLLLPVHYLHAMPWAHAGHAGGFPTTLVICTADGHVEITWPTPDEDPAATDHCPICCLAKGAAAAALPAAPALLSPWPIAASMAVDTSEPVADHRRFVSSRPRAPPIRA